MKIAIHHTLNSFSERWIIYCENNNIDYKLVNCYENDIIFKIQDCDVLMWHFHHASPKDILFAKQLLYSVEASGKKVFPNFKSAWYFDDKIGQKYLLESLKIPTIPSYVFYDRKSAERWAEEVKHPIVFKLRGGAGSVNVKLSKTKKQTLKLIYKSFSKGFKHSSLVPFKEVYSRYKNNKTNFKSFFKSLLRNFIPTEFSKVNGKEIGYVYFQDFIPNNDSDIRVIVIDDKAFAIKRMVRVNDFRASGSGNILYDKELLDIETIKLSFEISKKIDAQCLAFDFVYDLNKNPLVVEISYGFAFSAYDNCKGYWTEDLKWHEGKFDFCGWMVELMLKSINNK
uniref:ATP-grasp domain-containing protein n=1 Tax=Flavobacterium sp. TaxID=239 RepID=UPI00404A62A8